MLHLASNIRYVFECHEWLNKKCKNERILMKPWVQYPPTQMQDWRVTEVYPAQVLRRTHAPAHAHAPQAAPCTVCRPVPDVKMSQHCRTLTILS